MIINVWKWIILAVSFLLIYYENHINLFFKCYQFFNYKYGSHFDRIATLGESLSVVPYPILFDNDMKYVHAKFGASISMCMILSKNQIKQLTNFKFTFYSCYRGVDFEFVGTILAAFKELLTWKCIN